MSNMTSHDFTFYETGNYDRAVKAMRSAEDKVVQDIVRKVIKIKIKKQGHERVVRDIYRIPDTDCPEIVDYAKELDQLEDEEEWGKLSGQETMALFVTLSPEPGTATPEDMLETFNKMFGKAKKGVTIAVWSIEQSGTKSKDNIGYHPHVHCLIVLDKTNQSGERSKVKAMLLRNLKKYRTKSDAYLDIKPVSDRKIDDKLLYIKGEKRDKFKQEQVQADIEWRQEHGYSPFYASPE